MKKIYLFVLIFSFVSQLVFSDTYLEIIDTIIVFYDQNRTPPSNARQRNITGLSDAYLDYSSSSVKAHYSVYLSNSQYNRMVPIYVADISTRYGEPDIRDLRTVVYYTWEKENMEIELYCGPINGAIRLTIYFQK